MVSERIKYSQSIIYILDYNKVIIKMIWGEARDSVKAKVKLNKLKLTIKAD